MPDPAKPISIERLNDSHNRSNFSSGVEELDRYLAAHAGQDAKRKVAATFVLVDDGQRVLGFYTLSAYAIRLSDLPAETVKKLPKYPLLPATLLGRLAVSEEHQGKKFGQLLLADALRRSLANTREIGSIGVVVDALDDSAAGFYAHHEFAPLPGRRESCSCRC